MIYVGIDPGLSGAIARYDSDSGRVEIVDMPSRRRDVKGRSNSREIDLAQLGLVARSLWPWDVAMIEKVHAMPNQGVVSMFSFGRALGSVEQAFTSHLTRFAEPLYVRPQEWQGTLGLRGGKGSHRALASQIFPHDSFYFARVKDDGRADAALIAHYASIKKGKVWPQLGTSVGAPGPDV